MPVDSQSLDSAGRDARRYAREKTLFGFRSGGCHTSNMPADDDLLLRRFVRERAGAAFTELVRRHVDAVYSAALRRVGGDRHLAEDVTQQVFAALARHAAKLVAHPALGAWLHTATRHAAANTVRTERRRKAREQTAATMTDPSAASAGIIDWTRLAPVIDDAIDRLSEPDRTAVHLRFIENRSFAEIGAALRVSEDAARMRVDRALSKLRAMLARRGIGSTATALGFALADHAVAAAPAGLATHAAGHALGASASTTTSSMAGIFHAMTATKLTLVAAGAILLLAAIGTATHEVHRQQAAELALTADRQEVAALSERLQALESRTAATEREAAALQQKLSERLASRSSTAVTADSHASAQSVTPVDPVAVGRAFMARHPAVREAFNAWLNAQVNFEWSGFYEAAGLSQDQIAALQSLLSRGNAIEFSDPPNLKLAADALSPAEQESRLRALLGADNYQKLQAYTGSIPARNVGAQLAGALAFTPTPLTSDQFDQLTRTLAANGGVKMGTTGPQYNWDAITAEAQTILSPEQRPALDGLRVEAAYDQAYSRIMSAAHTANKPASDPAPTP